MACQSLSSSFIHITSLLTPSSSKGGLLQRLRSQALHLHMVVTGIFLVNFRGFLHSRARLSSAYHPGQDPAARAFSSQGCCLSYPRGHRAKCVLFFKLLNLRLILDL